VELGSSQDGELRLISQAAFPALRFPALSSCAGHELLLKKKKSRNHKKIPPETPSLGSMYCFPYQWKLSIFLTKTKTGTKDDGVSYKR